MNENDAALNALLEYISSSGRVCPMPDAWNRLYGMLPGAHRVGGGWNPPLPLILAAWGSSDDSKRARFVEHIRYAESNGAFGAVDTYLRSLPENEWYVTRGQVQ